MYLRFGILEGKGDFFWGCSSFPCCRDIQPYERDENMIDYLNDPGCHQDHIKSIQLMDKKDRFREIVNIKGQMLDILSHAIGCRLGGHVQFLHDYLIKDYLNNPKVLDYVVNVLKVEPVGWIIEQEWAMSRIFWENIRKVKSSNIQKYLRRKQMITSR